MHRNVLIIISFLVFGCSENPAVSKQGKLDPIASLFSKATISAEIKYREVDGKTLRLDVYAPSKRLGEAPWVEYDEKPRPVLLYFHGGGWRGGEKESRILEILPYIAKDWVVVTANYRVLSKATLPEIIGDCRAALDWVVHNGHHYGADSSRIFMAGNSAGGHLALMTGLIKDDGYFGSGIKFKEIPKIAGIINWYGITDVARFVDGWSDQEKLWDGQSDFKNMCAKTSPLTYITSDSPPIFTAHGTADPVVPFIHAQLLHQRLDEVGVKNKLYEVPNRKHGNFNAEEMTAIYREIWKFISDIEQGKQLESPQ